jgi:hypothetical protein
MSITCMAEFFEYKNEGKVVNNQNSDWWCTHLQ